MEAVCAEALEGGGRELDHLVGVQEEVFEVQSSERVLLDQGETVLAEV